MVKVDVVSVGMDKKINAYVALLQVRQGERTLPVFIGAFEAGAISMAIEQVRSPRPLVHELLRAMIEGLGGRVERVEILGMEADYYIACVELVTREGRHVRVDARPSDAVALALRSSAPIFIADEVVERSGVFLQKEEEAQPLLHPEAGKRRNGETGERQNRNGETEKRGSGVNPQPLLHPEAGKGRSGETGERQNRNGETEKRGNGVPPSPPLRFADSGDVGGRGEMDRLLARLRWLVREEAYEAAAEVRDRIGGGIEAGEKIEKKHVDMS